jgi:hypothetical protein
MAEKAKAEEANTNPIILNDPNPDMTATIEYCLEYLNNRLDLNTSLDTVRSTLNKDANSIVSVTDAIAAALRAENSKNCICAIHVAYILLSRKIKRTENEEEDELTHQKYIKHFPKNGRLFIIRKLIEKQLIEKFGSDSELAQILNFEYEIIKQEKQENNKKSKKII